MIPTKYFISFLAKPPYYSGDDFVIKFAKFIIRRVKPEINLLAHYKCSAFN